MSPYGKCRGRAIGSPAYRLANPCHSEGAPMLYEVRTYTLRPGTVAEFEERFAKRLRIEPADQGEQPEQDCSRPVTPLEILEATRCGTLRQDRSLCSREG